MSHITIVMSVYISNEKKSEANKSKRINPQNAKIELKSVQNKHKSSFRQNKFPNKNWKVKAASDYKSKAEVTIFITSKFKMSVFKVVILLSIRMCIIFCRPDMSRNASQNQIQTITHAIIARWRKSVVRLNL